MTNGDIVRQMSDEELAELMVITVYNAAIAILDKVKKSIRDQEEMSESVIEWLREEVHEDD